MESRFIGANTVAIEWMILSGLHGPSPSQLVARFQAELLTISRSKVGPKLPVLVPSETPRSLMLKRILYSEITQK